MRYRTLPAKKANAQDLQSKRRGIYYLARRANPYPVSMNDALKKEKPFKILSIDGGGIRGVFPAMFLQSLEAELKKRGFSNWKLHQQFDLICGTSTGGILAIGLALGIPATELYELYLLRAREIFGQKRGFLGRFTRSSYDRQPLENLLREKLQDHFNGNDPLINDCKTGVLITAYDLLLGRPIVIKTKHHSRYTRDYHMPAYMAALATGAAPTFFDPYSSEYIDLNGTRKQFNNKVDGGVFANNPTILGIIEAQEGFNQSIQNLRVLSLGTGIQTFSDSSNHGKWGINYWILKNGKKRIIDLFMQGQSQLTENLVGLMQFGVDQNRLNEPTFVYERVNTELTEPLNLDETDSDKLKRLSEKAQYEFNCRVNRIIDNYCND